MSFVTPDLVAAIYCIVVSLGGLLANGTLIILIATSKEHLQKDYIYFILNRAVADFAFCLFVGTLNPFAILATETNSNACVAAGFLAVALGSASMYSEPFLALNRYVSILKSQHYTRIYTRRNLILMCSCAWALALMASISDLLSDSLGRRIGFFCSLKFSTDSLAPILSMSYPFIFGGLTCIIVCNYKIFIYLKNYQTQSMTNNQMTQLQNDREMLRFLFASAFIPFVLQSPAGVIACVDMVRPLSSWFMFAGNTLYLISFTVNPVITVLMVRSIRKQFVKLVSKALKRHGSSTVDVERIGPEDRVK